MKTQAAWFVAAFVMVLLCHVPSAQANSLDDLLGFNPGPNRTYTYGVTNSGQSQNPRAVQYQPPTHPVGPAKRPQSMDAQQPGSPGTAYQQPIPQARPNLRQATPAKPSSKEKAGHRAAVKTSLPSAATVLANQPPNGRVAHSYQPNHPSQPHNVSRQRYSQQRPPSVYYSNPYQTRHTPARNYYQGYSYNTWGSSAYACPPGRA